MPPETVPVETPPLEITQCTPEAWPELVSVLAQAFNTTGEGWGSFRDRVGDENLRVARIGGQIVGGLGYYPMGQFFGGRSVPIGGIAGVGVAPHVRGQGVARAMVVDVLRSLRAAATPVSGLYPASLQVYRSCGFEQSGDRIQMQVELQTLRPDRFEVPVVPVDVTTPAAKTAIRARYRPAHGNLDRSNAIWERILVGISGTRRAWLIGDDGYVVLLQTPEGEMHYDLEVLDFGAPSPETLRTLLSLFASHRSLANNVRWYGGAADPLLALVPEPRWSIPAHQRWMLRICDVDVAFRARGWPPKAEGELHFDIHDALLPENSGRRILRVSDGQATVEPGGTGAISCDIRALGPLYSGYWSAETLVALGWITADGPTCAVASNLFASPLPWMREMY